MTYLQLLRCPRVKIDGFDFADVGAHPTVDTGAANAQKDTTDAHMKRRKINTVMGERTCSKMPNEDLRIQRSEPDDQK